MSHGAFLNSSGALLPLQGEVCWKVPIGSGKASSARPSELLVRHWARGQFTFTSLLFAEDPLGTGPS